MKIKISKKISRLSGFIFCWMIIKVSSLLPEALSEFLSRRAGDLLYFCWGRRRRISLSNLRLAFGEEKSEKEIREISRQSFQNLIENLYKTIYWSLRPLENWEENLVVEGEENLTEVLKEGKGAIAFTAHLACFPLIGTRFSRRGIPFDFVIRLPDDPFVEKYVKKTAEKSGVGLISSRPKHRCISKCLEILKNNKVICLLGDQYIKEGVRVKFFGHSTLAAAGPVVLSLRSGAQIVPMFIAKKSDKKYHLYIEKPFSLKLTGERDKDIASNVGQLTEIIETYVRRYPQQWAWMHRRWREEKQQKQ